MTTATIESQEKLGKTYVTAGKAVFTVEIPTTFQQAHSLLPHYTFRVRHKPASGCYRDAYFLQLLTGPDNTADYTYIGMLNHEDGTVRATGKSHMSGSHILMRLISRTLQVLWTGEDTAFLAAGFSLHHEGKCGRCGRALTVPDSIRSGIGPECRKRVQG